MTNPPERDSGESTENSDLDAAMQILIAIKKRRKVSAPSDIKEGELLEFFQRFTKMHQDECRLDHQGYCQAHFLDHAGAEGCLVVLARKILAALPRNDGAPVDVGDFRFLLAKTRKDFGVSQSMLAKRAAVTQSGISQIESGERDPSLEMMRRLGTALGVSWRISWEKSERPEFRQYREVSNETRKALASPPGNNVGLLDEAELVHRAYNALKTLKIALDAGHTSIAAHSLALATDLIERARAPEEPEQ